MEILEEILNLPPKGLLVIGVIFFFFFSKIVKSVLSPTDREEHSEHKRYDTSPNQGDYFEEAKKLFQEMQNDNKSPQQSAVKNKKKKKPAQERPVTFFSYDDLQDIIADPKNHDRNFDAIDENYAQGENCGAHLQEFLQDSDNLKTGILVSEVLGKPLSMRDERGF